jgi:hypothetical protein
MCRWSRFSCWRLLISTIYCYHYIYTLKYVIKEINLLFFKCIQMFRHKSNGKGRKGKSSSSSQARSVTFADLFAVMVLLNFYLHVLIHYYFTASHLIYFIVIFVFRALRPLDTDRRLSWGFAQRRPTRDGRCVWRMERLNKRRSRSQTSEQPSRKLLRSRVSRTRLMTSHRSSTS